MSEPVDTTVYSRPAKCFRTTLFEQRSEILVRNKETKLGAWYEVPFCVFVGVTYKNAEGKLEIWGDSLESLPSAICWTRDLLQDSATLDKVITEEENRKHEQVDPAPTLRRCEVLLTKQDGEGCFRARWKPIPLEQVKEGQIFRLFDSGNHPVETGQPCLALENGVTRSNPCIKNPGTQQS